MRPGLRNALWLIAAAAVAALGYSRRAPAGVEKLSTGPQAHAQRFYPQTRRIVYIRGGADDLSKSYLCVYELASGKSRCSHFADYELSGDFEYLEEADAALASATFTGEDKEQRRIILVSLKDGSVLRTIPEELGSKTVILAKPAWTDRAFIVASDQGGTMVESFDPAEGRREAFKAGTFQVSRAVFLRDRPLAVFDASSSGGEKLVLYDLRKHAALQEFPLDSAYSSLSETPAGVIGWRPSSSLYGYAVEEWDAKSGKLLRLADRVEAVESAVRAKERVYLTSRDSSGKAESNDQGLHPRELSVIEAGQAMQSQPWTKRRGRLFGYDEASGRLLFAATEPMSTWALSAERPVLAKAARELDRRTGEVLGADAESLMLLLAGVGIIVFGAIAAYTKPQCKSCG